MAVASGLTLLLLGACGGDADEPAGTDATVQPPATPEQTEAPADAESHSPAGQEIPDGRYEKTDTVEDAKAAGLTDEQIEEFLGADGLGQAGMEIDGTRWEHLVTNDAGVEEVGDLGTLEYDDEGRAVFTSESTGCPGCVATVEWTLESGTLTLTPLGLDPIDAFVVGGEWTPAG